MSDQVHLNDQQVAQFARDGLLKLDGLMSTHCVALARQAVLRPLEALGLWRDGSWRLDDRPRPIWPATGLKPARDIGHRHPEVEALIKEPAVKAVIERLTGAIDFDRQVYPRPQVLASLPNCDSWVMPTGWHTDLPRLASGSVPGVQLFAFLDSVRPRGGGTMFVAGSHRLLNDGRNLKVKEITAALGREPFFQQLFGSLSDDGDENALPVGRVGGVRVEVLELIGEPGDVWLMDLRVLHSAAPNCSPSPRLMATHRFVRADLMPEIGAAFGWT